MTSRERIVTAIRRQEPDRLPCVEQSFWPETLARWSREGLPHDTSPGDYFDLDRTLHLDLDASLRLPARILEETANWVIESDADGVIYKRWRNDYGPPAMVDTLIRSREDWERYRDRLAPCPERIGSGIRESIVAAAPEGRFCTISPGEPVWWVLRTLGMERALMLLGDDPGLFADMLEAQASLGLALVRGLLEEGFRPDGVWFSSDLCYRNGMLFSPACYRRYMMEYHRRFARLCREYGLLFLLHCDGDVRRFLPLLIEAGFDCIEPLEARAGNDVRELKPLCGDRISFFGNINMDVLAAGDRNAIAREVIGKVEAAKAGGGYIFQSDHSVPPTVSLDAYRFAVELAREHGQY
ncbi:MAG: hypothetical protein IT210_19100 [Armatimonadetes bacterium]|nr:hypothetical protein [Armatimonadota bacterium]